MRHSPNSNSCNLPKFIQSNFSALQGRRGADILHLGIHNVHRSVRTHERQVCVMWCLQGEKEWAWLVPSDSTAPSNN